MDKDKTIPTLSKTAVSGSVILPTHLRIGNLVIRNGVVYEVWDLKRKELELDSQKLDRHIMYCTYDELYPIPISEKLLLELGAIDLDYKNYPSYNLKGLQVNFVNGMWIEYVSRVELAGLHWLQNIFFFRMNEELCVSTLTDR